MTWHFLKRDFRDYALYWLIVLILTVLLLLAGKSGLWILFNVYYFFAIMAEPHVLGSIWRNQHLLSRHYLLSLPLSHKKLFVIQQIRMVVFWLPLLFLAAIYPYVAERTLAVRTWFYDLALLVSVLLFMNSQLWSVLESEKISSYLPKGQRLWAYAKLFIVLGGPFILLIAAWTKMILPFTNEHERLPWFFSFGLWVPAEWVFAGAFLLLIFWIPHNARRWCVTV